MDEPAVREIFETALATQEPAFGRFFLARFLGFDISFEDETALLQKSGGLPLAV